MASTHRTTPVASLAQLPVGVPRLVRYHDPVEGFQAGSPSPANPSKTHDPIGKGAEGG